MGNVMTQPLTPGTASLDITVYEPTSDAKTVSVGSRYGRFSAQGR